jgi:hypothetical protein
MSPIKVTNEKTNASIRIEDADYSIIGAELIIREDLSTLSLQKNDKISFNSKASVGTYELIKSSSNHYTFQEIF